MEAPWIFFFFFFFKDVRKRNGGEYEPDSLSIF